MATDMYVRKRDGSLELVSFDKILTRIRNLLNDQELGVITGVDAYYITQKVIDGIVNGIETAKLDELAAQISDSLVSRHTNYGKFAARIFIDNYRKNIQYLGKKYSASESPLLQYIDMAEDILHPLVVEYVRANADFLSKIIKYKRDYKYSYFGFQTLKKGYLLENANHEYIEVPQHLYICHTLGLLLDKLGEDHPGKQLQLRMEIIDTYNALSKGYYTHATPTLASCRKKTFYGVSCFLTMIKDDSIEGIYDTIKECALISKASGGIGLSVNNVRSKDTYIKGTGGFSNGILPMLLPIESTAKYVDQGGGKRPGAFAVFMEPWHADFPEFVTFRSKNAPLRMPKLNNGIWMCDLFMKVLKARGTWYMFSPHDVPELNETFGDEFEAHYWAAVDAKKYRRTMPATKLWELILATIGETGEPYIGAKDTINKLSNQSNLGIVRSSNLCMEITEVTDQNTTAACNLASIALPKFVKIVDGKATFDFEKFRKIIFIAVRNLDNVITLTKYPTEAIRVTNQKNRPLGLGIQGFADLLIDFKVDFDSNEALRWAAEIAEAMYYYALEASIELAEERGRCDAFDGSPLSKGIFHWELYELPESKLSGRHDWASLRASVMKHGARNSLLIALMPTASTSQILGNTECFEPIKSIIITRRTGAGNYEVICDRFIKAMEERGLWTPEMARKVSDAKGLIQDIKEIPLDIRRLFRGAYEMSPMTQTKLAIARAPFVDQSQSMNLFARKKMRQDLSDALILAWKKKCKTMIYYYKTPGQEPEKITKKVVEVSAEDGAACPIGCTSCSS